MDLLAQGLEKTDAEPLGKTVGLDILALYEHAADRFFAKGNFGRALEYLFISSLSSHSPFSFYLLLCPLRTSVYSFTNGFYLSSFFGLFSVLLHFPLRFPFLFRVSFIPLLQ